MGGEPAELTVWRWLPTRALAQRLTDPASIALGTGLAVRDVQTVLVRMEAAGHVVRDAREGRRAGHWHRGAPPPGAETPAVDEPGLW